jgi:hypothetical protein
MNPEYDLQAAAAGARGRVVLETSPPSLEMKELTHGHSIKWSTSVVRFWN